MIFHLSSDSITLAQLLKAADFIDTGGQARYFLQDHPVFINGEQDQRRGRQLKRGDLVQVAGTEILIK